MEQYEVVAGRWLTGSASLRAAGGCPPGMYLAPSPGDLLAWHGVLFVHRGPYAGSVLRFTLLFPASYPQSAPVVRFDSDVFHRGVLGVASMLTAAMVDPRTKEWSPRGRLVHWRPRVDHVPHLLHSLKASFKQSALDAVPEDEAVNKQVWSLYTHSRQTFISMTAQRAYHSVTRAHLYPACPGPIAFVEIGDDERDRLWIALKQSLGLHV